MPSTSEVAASVGQTVLATGPVKVGGKKQKTEKGGKAANKALVRHTRKVKKAYKTFVKLANKKVGGQILGEQIVGGRPVTLRSECGEAETYVPTDPSVPDGPGECTPVGPVEKPVETPVESVTPPVETPVTPPVEPVKRVPPNSAQEELKPTGHNLWGGRRKSIKKTSFKPGSLVKGSQEAKDYMASLRAMRK